jgi:hypothetical protein
VPIPFRDADDLEDLGAVAFLKIERSARDSVSLGALFVTNARGEPLEFAYNLVETSHRILWRPADLRRNVERELATSLLAICATTPRLLLCRADEVGSSLFTRDLELAIPVGRLSAPAGPGPIAASVNREEPDPSEPVQVFWHPAPPAEGSSERQLFDRLSAQGLLLEPFERASYGLREVYAARLSDAP